MDPKINLDGTLFHMTCAKCSECNCQITLANFTKIEGGLMCKTHYLQKFKESGGKYVSKVAPGTEKKVITPTVKFTPMVGQSGPAPRDPEVAAPQRPAMVAAPATVKQVTQNAPTKPAETRTPVIQTSSEEEESSPAVEAEPASSQFLEEPGTSEELSAPTVMSEEEFAAVFESGMSLSAPPPPKPSHQEEEVEVEAVAPPRRASTRLSNGSRTQTDFPGVNPSRRTKHAIPRPSNDFADLDYDILTVKTNLVYGYEGEYDAEGRKCGRGIYKYPGTSPSSDD